MHGRIRGPVMLRCFDPIGIVSSFDSSVYLERNRGWNGYETSGCSWAIEADFEGKRREEGRVVTRSSYVRVDQGG